MPATVPLGGTLAFDRLGAGFPLSGALIKNAVLRAAFRAAKRGVAVDQALLEAAANEELSAATGEQSRGPLGFQ